jgi:hypothetical protein
MLHNYSFFSSNIGVNYLKQKLDVKDFRESFLLTESEHAAESEKVFLFTLHSKRHSSFYSAKKNFQKPSKSVGRSWIGVFMYESKNLKKKLLTFSRQNV